jgi:dienelactone hydrolase
MGVDGFTEEPFTALGKTRTLYRRGDGPAVIVIHEVPGITPQVAKFGRDVADAGMTAVLPSLFGTPGRPLSAAYGLVETVKACVSREFATLALDRTSPITDWLRALARAEHERCGGPGVGAVGMCLTGGFALAMMLDDTTVVLSQPSLPFPLGKARKAAVGLSDADFERVKERVAAGTCVLGLRFEGDPVATHDRFVTLREALGDNFVGSSSRARSTRS